MTSGVLPGGWRRWRTLLVLVIVAGLAAFYLAGAHAHATLVNTSKARGDQSGYLWDAKRVYANWHGQTPPYLIGERNRMPVYAGFLALFYDPTLSDPAFFEAAKVWNIRLSLALVGLLWLAFVRHLPRLPAANLTLVVAFGCFIFKAGYVQSELLFYTLFFLTFLAAWHLLVARRASGMCIAGAALGVLAGLAQLTKASAVPLFAIVVVVCLVDGVGRILRAGRADTLEARREIRASAAWRLASGALATVCLLGVLYPYLSTSKQVFGRWFYNVNTTFYVWYDNWPAASAGTYSHGDGVGWPTLPPSQIPTARSYLRTHTARQILARVADGLADIVSRLYLTFWVLKYLLIYALLVVLVVSRHRQAFTLLVRRHAALFAFLALYGAVYLGAIAFYAPVSGTGTSRFVLAHLAPLLFAVSMLLARRPFADSRWTFRRNTITLGHLHLLVTLSIGLDLAVRIWPRLMTTYGGF